MLTMKKADYEKILAHAKENLPEEACGLIAGTKDGDKKIIEKVYLLENVDHTNESEGSACCCQRYACKRSGAAWQLAFPSGIAVTSVRGR